MTEELSSWFLRGYRLDWIGFERVHLISTPAENESINLLIPSHSENDSKSTMTVHSALLAFDLMFMMTEELFSWFLRGYRSDWTGFERVHLISTPAENESVIYSSPVIRKNDSKSTMTVPLS